MRASALLLACLVAACRPAPAPERAAEPPDVRAQAPAQAADDLFGEWQVAAFDTPLLRPEEARLGDPTRVVLLIGAGSIDAASQCVPFFFRYRGGVERIEVEPVRWLGPVCARGLLPYERVFEELLAGATRVERVPGGVRLSGASGSVTLRRPEGGRAANPFGNEPPPGPQLLWGHFRLVDAGGVRPSPEMPIDIALGRQVVEARSNCHFYRWAVRMEQPGLSLEPQPWPVPVCEEGLNEAERALERLMPAVRRAEWVAPWRVRLVGAGGAVTLERVGGS